MGVQERVLASWLSERIAENQEYAKKIGISAVMRKTDSVLMNKYQKTAMGKIVDRRSIEWQEESEVIVR